MTLAGFMENVREVGGSLAFVVLRDFYGTTQLVVEDAELLALVKSLNKETTLQVIGVVRERSSKNPKQPTGDIEVVPSQIKVLAAAATTSFRLRSTAAVRRTRPSGCATVIWICATRPSNKISFCAATWSPLCAKP